MIRAKNLKMKREKEKYSRGSKRANLLYLYLMIPGTKLRSVVWNQKRKKKRKKRKKTNKFYFSTATPVFVRPCSYFYVYLKKKKKKNIKEKRKEKAMVRSKTISSIAHKRVLYNKFFNIPYGLKSKLYDPIFEPFIWRID